MIWNTAENEQQIIINKYSRFFGGDGAEPVLLHDLVLLNRWVAPRERNAQHLRGLWRREGGGRGTVSSYDWFAIGFLVLTSPKTIRKSWMTSVKATLQIDIYKDDSNTLKGTE